MELKVLPRLSIELTDRLKQFVKENFYTEEEKIPELLAEEEERFFSQPEAWILVFERDQIIGCTLLHKRKVKFNNQDVISGGIGRVCTRKDKRTQGIATMMLKKSVKILKKWGCDTAYLCANIERTGSLYAQVGFVPLNKPYTYYGRSGKLYEENNGMIAPINSSRLFEKVLHSKQKLHLGLGNW